MTNLTISLEEGEVTLDVNKTYLVFGDKLQAEEVSKLDLSHLPWLDQVTVLQDIELQHEVSILYHPEVMKSIFAEEENSRYWGKDKYEALAIFKRDKLGQQTVNKSENETLLKGLPDKRNIAVRKSQTVKILDGMGYGRTMAKSIVNDFLNAKGLKYINFSPAVLAEKIDLYTRS